MESIKEILIRRDNMTEEEASKVIEEAQADLQTYLNEGDMEGAENICQEYFGLEPDYIHELI